MILGQISYLDCIAFLLFLVPQLLIHINVFELVLCVLKALPFFCTARDPLGPNQSLTAATGIRLPIGFVEERFFRRRWKRSPFAQQSSAFQDFVIRCVRYAFANMPANIGKVFFSRNVSLPFVRFRMWRQGVLQYPIDWHEIEVDGVKGVLIRDDMSRAPDVIIYYCHGGGFAMGTPHFYLEPLLGLVSLLKEHYCNPALFAVDYSLVPEAQHPTQLTEVLAGYSFVQSLVEGDASRICVSGDSAGGTLVLSLLLQLAKDSPGRRPGYAALISPWIKLFSEKNVDTPSDFLNAHTLHVYGQEYAGSETNLKDPIVSPGCCTDLDWWKKAAPIHGFYLTYGSEELLAPEIRVFAKLLRSGGVGVRLKEEPGAIHAWVIARLFLEDTMADRMFGIKEVVRAITYNFDPTTKQQRKKQK